MKWHTETRKLSDLKEWENNPRTITDTAYQRLKKSIKERGFHDIIKIDEKNVVLSGNQLLKDTENE
jgi:ParB-like chromosome segregation protein Spo0J